MSRNSLEEMYAAAVNLLLKKGIHISTMESCTGGFVSSCITDIEGASGVMNGAFVTYCNDAKIRQGVDEWIIERYGVYSLPTAFGMAEACRKAYSAEIGVGITGTIGRIDPNNGDSSEGVAYVCVCSEEVMCVKEFRFEKGKTRKECKECIAEYAAEAVVYIANNT